jgi:hypothetical protein
MFRVLFAPILRSTTAAYSHRCVYGFGTLVHFSLKLTVPKAWACLSQHLLQWTNIPKPYTHLPWTSNYLETLPTPSDFDVQWNVMARATSVSINYLQASASVLTVLSEVAKNCSTFKTLFFCFSSVVSVFASVCLSVCLVYVYIFVMYVSICLCGYLCLTLHPSIHSSIVHPFICLCLYVCLFIYLSVCFSVCISPIICSILCGESCGAHSLNYGDSCRLYMTLFGFGGVYRRSRESCYLHNLSRCI